MNNLQLISAVSVLLSLVLLPHCPASRGEEVFKRRKVRKWKTFSLPSCKKNKIPEIFTFFVSCYKRQKWGKRGRTFPFPKVIELNWQGCVAKWRVSARKLPFFLTVPWMIYELPFLSSKHCSQLSAVFKFEVIFKRVSKKLWVENEFHLGITWGIRCPHLPFSPGPDSLLSCCQPDSPWLVAVRKCQQPSSNWAEINPSGFTLTFLTF